MMPLFIVHKNVGSNKSYNHNLLFIKIISLLMLKLVKYHIRKKDITNKKSELLDRKLNVIPYGYKKT